MWYQKLYYIIVNNIPGTIKQQIKTENSHLELFKQTNKKWMVEIELFLFNSYVDHYHSTVVRLSKIWRYKRHSLLNDQ